MEKDYNAARCAAGKGSADGAARIKGGYSLSAEREYPPLHPPRERALIGSFGLERLLCLRNGNACARRCRVRTARRFASASIIRYRSADLVEVQTNFRLPRHSSMRRAPAMPHSARSLPPKYCHSRLTIVRRGCYQSRIAEDSWRSHVHRTYIAQRVQFFELQACNVRGQGAEPLAFSWGFKGDILSRERISPLSRAAPAALLPLPHSAGVSSILLINRQPKRQFDTKLLSPLSLLLVFSASFIIVRRHAEQR